MGAARAIDKEINQYLGQLNTKQKRAVLTVVKTFAEDQNEMMEPEGEYSTTFKAELDRRTTEFESGKTKGYTLDEVEAGARKAYKAKAKKRVKK